MSSFFINITKTTLHQTKNTHLQTNEHTQTRVKYKLFLLRILLSQYESEHKKNGRQLEFVEGEHFNIVGKLTLKLNILRLCIGDPNIRSLYGTD